MSTPTISPNGQFNQSGIGYGWSAFSRSAKRCKPILLPDPSMTCACATPLPFHGRDMSELDPEPAWKQMRKAGKQLFKALDAFAIARPLIEWTEKLADTEDHSKAELLAHFGADEAALEARADACGQQLRRSAVGTMARITEPACKPRYGSAAWPSNTMALEKWVAARELHRIRAPEPQQVSWHQLRIGIKRFRYMLENFVPALHSQFASDLKEIQDLLGDVHRPGCAVGDCAQERRVADPGRPALLAGAHHAQTE